MDWISTVIGALGGGGISAILLFKQNKSSATADAIDKILQFYTHHPKFTIDWILPW